MEVLYTVENAQEHIRKLQEQIKKIEEFVEQAKLLPEDTVEEKAIKYYAYSGKSVEVANKLNEEGYRIDKRKWKSTDVTEIIDRPSNDPFLKLLREFYKKRFKSAMRKYG